MIISYKEFKPHPHLQPYIENYWLQVFNGEKNEESPTQKCLPLGMVQIIVHTHEQECLVHQNGQWRRLPDMFFVGLYKDAVSWKTVGSSVCFGINIKPENLVQFFNVPAAALYNEYTDVSNFLQSRINTLADQLMGHTNGGTLVAIAEAYLLNRLKDIQSERSYITEATKLIRESKGSISIQELCKSLYVCERQLQRTFKDALGASPKVYTRIIRFRNAYQYVRATKASRLSWASLSYDFGYADQAHFIRDFKEFTGAVPSLVVEDKLQYYQLTTGSIPVG